MSHRIPPSLDDFDCLLPTEAPRWFAVRVIGGRERTAAENVRKALRGRGLRAYAPTERYWQRRHGPRARVTRAVIPGYIFVEATTDDFHRIRGADGVIGFLSHTTATGFEPAAAPLDVMQFIGWLAFVEGWGGLDRTWEPPFKPGQDIKVAVGQFADWPGKVISLTPSLRVKVMLEAFGQKHEKELPYDQLKAA